LPRVTRIRYWVTGGYTRIAVDLDDQAPYRAARVAGPDRIYFDLSNTRLSPELMGKSVTVTGDRFLKRIRAAQYSNDVTRIVLDIGSATDYSAFFLPNPWRLIIDIHGRKDGAPALEASANPSSGSSRLPSAPVSGLVSPHRPLSPPSPLPPSHNELESLESLDPPLSASPGPAGSPASSMVRQTSALTLQPDRLRSAKRLKSEPPSAIDLPAIREAEPTADGERSMVRTLGLKIGRIVLDAGHGGHDCGTVGPGGIQEKDIVLDVTLRLGKLLRRRLGADVIYTRGDDTFIPLETRTAIANKSRADLFISIHANSSSDPAARGVESYYLNFTTSPDALEVAARENAVSDASIHELSDLVKKIALRSKIEESREFATDVQSSLYDGLEAGNPGLKDRGVKKAPFVVLIGANMPSILAEISFLTNPDDARELSQPAYRERIAESLYHGIAKYIHGLSGIRLAENGDRSGN
jgi:N-acetylmuramoyl-L-alanine amidase